MKSLRLLIALTFASQFLPSSYGATYYVSPAGSDGNSGTSSAPLLTIQRAANMVNPGDTVVVRDGTYSNAAASGTGSKLITMTRGGTASSWVTFMAEHTWGAVVDGLNNTTAEGWSFAANYIRVQGFEVKGFSDDAFSNYGGGQYISIMDNNIHDMGRYCATTGIGRDGIYLGHDNVTVERNVIHDIGRYAPGENGCTNSLYYQTNDHGIYVSGANNVMIRNNIFYRNLHGWSVHVYPTAINNLSVLNNTFAFANTWASGYVILAAGVTNSRIDNNIFYQANTAGVHYYVTTGFAGLAINNNITYQATIADAAPSGVSMSGNKDNTNPLLANPSSYDFRLTSGSPAIDGGLTLADVPNDYTGLARPQGAGYDQGAFEFAAQQFADLTIAATHSGSFTQGQTGATYTISVSNAGVGPTVGTVTVTDALPTGLTATGLSGTGWSCTLSPVSCGRSDGLASGGSYPAITLTASVAANAASSITNTATVSGGGEVNTSNDTATDPTTVNAVVAPPEAPQSGTYYVSPTGSDSNPGSSSAPFKTIQRAANLVNPGDTVIVRDGTYSNAAATGVGSKLITMSRGGTASSWVTFMAEHTWGAVIDGLSNTTAEGWSFGASYIRVQGFEVKGFSDDAFSNYGGGQHLDIVGNHIHDMGRYCTTTGIGRDGIYLSSSNVTVEQNVIHDIGRYAPGENGCSNSAYYQTNDHAIYVSGANNVMIRNNVFYRNVRGWSIQVYPNAVDNLSILNNTFAFPNPWEPGHIIVAAPVTNSRIDNNVFYQPTTAGVHFYTTSGFSNLTLSNNITHQGTIADATPAGVTKSANKDNTDPMLANPSGYDFRLTSGSPAIDTGVMLADVPQDYAGLARPQGAGYDLGAFEFAGSSGSSGGTGGTGGTGDTGGSGAPQPADLTIAMTHSGSFTQGQTGGTYTISVSNAGAGPTAGIVTVTDAMPSGMTTADLRGSGWTCSLSGGCTRNDVLAAGGSYPPITVTVSVSGKASGSLTNTATVSGGGEVNTSNDTATDPTTVQASGLGRKNKH